MNKPTERVTCERCGNLYHRTVGEHGRTCPRCDRRVPRYDYEPESRGRSPQEGDAR